jgi:hypothetical protein
MDNALEQFENEVNLSGSHWNMFYHFIPKTFLRFGGTSLVCKGGFLPQAFYKDFMTKLAAQVNLRFPNSVHVDNSPTNGWSVVRDTGYLPT